MSQTVKPNKSRYALFSTKLERDVTTALINFCPPPKKKDVQSSVIADPGSGHISPSVSFPSVLGCLTDCSPASTKSAATCDYHFYYYVIFINIIITVF